MRKLFLFCFVLRATVFFSQDTVKVAPELTVQQLGEVDYNHGVEAMKKNHTTQALDLFTKCIEKNPAFDKAYANRCQIYLKQKKYNEALEDIDKAIKINFKNPDYYFDKSLVFYHLGLRDSQDVALDECLRLDGTHADAAYYKGMNLYEQNDFDRAMGYYSVALFIRPNFAYAFNDRATAHRAKGELDSAIADYKRALKNDSTHAFIYNNFGSLYKMKKNYDLAIAAYTKAYKCDVNYLIALLNRGNVYFELGNYSKAKADYEEALFVNANSSFAYNNLASIALKNKDYEKARDLASRSIELDAENGAAYYNRGIALQMLKDEAASCADWKKASQLGVTDAKSFFNSSCLND